MHGFLAPFRRAATAAALLGALLPATADAQIWNWKRLPDPRGEFVRLCAPHMVSRWAHPESVCQCLHDHALAGISDTDLREALLRGISETGVPAIEDDWIPVAKRAAVNATFTQIARPTLQCMFAPVDGGSAAPLARDIRD